MMPGELHRQVWVRASQGITSRLGRLWSPSARLFTQLQHRAAQRPNVCDAAASAYRAGTDALAKARSQQDAAVVAVSLMHPDSLPALTVDSDLWKGPPCAEAGGG